MSIVGRSIIIDISDNWVDQSAHYMAVRSVEFILNGTILPVTSGFTAYATSSYPGYNPATVFNTALSKIGSWGGRGWLSGDGNITNQRLIIVFDAPITFDGIVINNGHTSGEACNCGIKTVVIAVSGDPITDTAYDTPIANSVVFFDGVVNKHIEWDAEDEFVLGLSTLEPIHHWNMEHLSGSNVVDEVLGKNLAAVGWSQVPGWDDQALSQPDTTYPLGLPTDTAFKAVSLWIRRTNLNNYGVFAATADANHLCAIRNSSTGNYLYFYHGSGGTDSNLVIADTNWHHVWVIEGSDSNHHWYWLDGIKAASEIVSNFNGVLKYFSRPNYAIGQENLILDNVQWYQRIPSDTELVFLARATSQEMTLGDSESNSLRALIFDQPYGDFYYIYEKIFNQLYDLTKELSIDILQPYSDILRLSFNQLYGDLPILRHVFNQPYRSLPVRMLDFNQPWQALRRLSTVFGQPYNLQPELQISFDQPYDLTLQYHICDFTQPYDLDELKRLSISFDQPYVLCSGQRIIEKIDVSVTIGGRPIDPHYIRYGGTEDDYDLSIELRVPSTQWLEARLGESIVITLPDDVVYGLVDDLSSSESSDSRDYTVRGSAFGGDSIISLLDDEILLESFGAGLANEIVAELAGRYGVLVIWQSVIGWPIPDSTLYANNETALSVIRKIISAVGAVMQPTLAGDLLIRPRYIKNVSEWPSATPDLVLSDQDFLFSISAAQDIRSRYNSFLVSSGSSSGISVRLEDETVTDTSKLVRGYVIPWTAVETLPALTHSSGSWVTIEKLTTEERIIEDEEVDIVGGVSNLQYPVYGDIDVVYRESDLGSMLAEEDGTITTETAGESLAVITYTTRCLRWLVTNPKGNNVQVFIPEES